MVGFSKELEDVSTERDFVTFQQESYDSMILEHD